MLQPAPKKKYVPTAKEKKNLDDASKNINMKPPFPPEERKKMKNYSNMGKAKSGTTMKKAKSGFAALAPPYDKATFADKIAGAKANAGKAKSGTKMKKAMSGYGGKAASMVPMKSGGKMKKAMMGNTMMAEPMMKSGGKMAKCKYGCK